MSKLATILDEWSRDAESELRIHAGVPAERRTEARDIVHNAILGAFDEMVKAKDFDEIVRLRREELAEMEAT